MDTLELCDFQELQTERLQLSTILASDVNEIYFLRSNKQVLQYLDKKPAASTEEALEWIKMIQNFYASKDGYTWGIHLKNNPQLIGTIGFWNFNKTHYRAEIGYTLHPDFQGKGIMHEAMKAVLDFGFNQMNFHSIEANVNPSNEKSIQVLLRQNFVKEAHFKENYFFDGKFIDSAIYSLLATEYLKS